MSRTDAGTFFGDGVTAMKRPFKQITFEKRGDVHGVCILQSQFDENGLDELSAEVGRLIDEGGCRKMVMTFASGDPLCLYSVFLAKLVNLQRRLGTAGGALALAGLSENAQHIFEAAGLHKFFTFYPNVDAAVKEMG